MANTRFEMILDIEPSQFQRIERTFLRDLAGLMKANPSDIWILDVHAGCTILLLQGPEEEVNSFIAQMNSFDRPEGFLAFKKDVRLRQLFRSDSPEAPTVHTVKSGKRINLLPSSTRRSGETFSWIHLSDVHLRADEGGDAYVQDVVTASFLQYLPILLKARGISPEIIFFTGDIAFSGQNHEYEAASSFFDRLLRTFDPKPRLMFIPGNHDVNWNMVDKDLDRKLDNQLQSDITVAKYLMDKSSLLDRQKGFLRLQNYNQFSDRCKVFQQPERNHEYFYTTKFEHKGLTIGVCGLNSSWRCTSREVPSEGRTPSPDLGRLLLGRTQLQTAVQAMEDCDVRIALLHHPAYDAWFMDFDKGLQGKYLPEFDYVLRGHEHVFVDSVIGRWNSPETMQLSGGALYQADPYSKVFSALVMEPASGMQTVFKWKYDTDDEKWHAILEPDQDQPGYRAAMPNRLYNRLASKQAPKQI